MAVKRITHLSILEWNFYKIFSTFFIIVGTPPSSSILGLVTPQTQSQQLSAPPAALTGAAVTESHIDLNRVLVIQNAAPHTFSSSISQRLKDNGSSSHDGPRTYFGLSVTLIPGWIFIAAPRSNISDTDTKFVEPGVVHRCKLTTAGSKNVGGQQGSSKIRKPKCDLITFPEKTPCMTNKKDKAWHATCENSFNGGSMTYDPIARLLFVCSPGWNHGTSYEVHFARPEGQCHILDHLNDDDDRSGGPREAGRLVPFSTDAFRGPQSLAYYETTRWFFAGMGISSHVIEPSSQSQSPQTNLDQPKHSELLIGAPGVLNHNGSILWYKNPREENEKVNLLLPELFDQKRGDLGDLYYLGYAVTSGKFFSNETLVAAGSPRGVNLRGFVLLAQFKDFVQEPQNWKDCFWASPNTTECQNGFFKENTWSPLWSRRGDKFASYFGSSLAAVDVNGDGFDELFVGAPLQKSSSPSAPSFSSKSDPQNLKSESESESENLGEDTGCVFIFTKGSQQFKKLPQVLCGTTSGGRFGSAMASLGDINNDGLNDIAIGAPYEDKVGAIYIYFGNNYGIDQNSKFLRIPASPYSPQFSGFGSSVVGNVDIDGNGTPDFAVGDYKSEKVVIFRTRPALKFMSHSMTLIVNGTRVKKLPINCHQFDLRLCVQIKIFILKNFNETEIPHENNIIIFAKLTMDTRHRRFRVSQVDGKNFSNPAHILDDLPLVFPPGQSSRCVNLSLVRNPGKLNEDDLEDEDPILIRRRLVYTATASKSPVVTTYTISSGQEEGPEIDDFCPTCPIPVTSDPGMVDTLTFQSKNCTAASGLCVANLTVDFVLEAWDEIEGKERKFKGNGSKFLMGSAQFLKLTVTLHNGPEYTALWPAMELTFDPQFETQNPSVDEQNLIKSHLFPILTNHTLSTDFTALTPQGPFTGNLTEGGKFRRNSQITHVLWLSFKNVLAIQRKNSKLTIGSRVSGQNFKEFFQNFTLDFDVDASISLGGEDKTESWPLTPAHSFFGFNVTVNGTSPLVLNLTVRFPMGVLISNDSGEVTQFQLLTVHPGNSGFKASHCIQIGGPVYQKVSLLEDKFDTELTKKDVSNFDLDKFVEKSTTKDNGGRVLTFNCDDNDQKHNSTCMELWCLVPLPKNFRRFQDKLQVRVKNNMTKSLMDHMNLGSIVFNARSTLQFLNDGAEIWTAYSKIVIRKIPQEEIKLWILIVSAIVAFIVLICVILALCMCGFFRRDAKEKLEALKAEAELENTKVLVNRYGDQSQQVGGQDDVASVCNN